MCPKTFLALLDGGVGVGDVRALGATGRSATKLCFP